MFDLEYRYTNLVLNAARDLPCLENINVDTSAG